MSQVVTELVIDSNTSAVGDFTRAMDGAEEAANRGVAAATGFSAGVLALGAGALGAIATVKSMLDQVVEANKGLADLQTQATRTGLSLADLQGIQFGGAIAGLGTSQINAGLEKSAALLNDASRNSNSLSKELDANGISIKNANGQLITQNQLIGIAADLISRAKNPGDQLAIAQMLGFTKEWIPLLEQGAGAMSGLTAEARAAGAVIDDETIQRATDFDTQWRKSSVEFSSYMKAAMTSLLPFIDDLIERAGTFLNSIDRGKVEQAANDQLNQFGVSNESPLAITVTPDALQAIKDLQENVGTFSQAIDAAARVLGGISIRQTYPVSDDPMQGSAYPKNGPADFNALQKATDWADDAAGDAAGGFSKVANKDTGGGSDAVDRAINSLQKHTQQQLADAQAVGLGDAALAGFKAEAAETAAVMANGGKETDAQVDKFSDLKDAAVAAADALAKAKVASQIDFGGKTAFLSAGDVAIAQQLKGIYGNDITAALNSAEAAQLRFNATTKELSSAIENNLVSGLTDIATGTVAVGQGFTNMGIAVLKSIEQMIIKIAIVQPMMAALQASVSSSGILSFLGLGGSNAIAAGGVVPGAIGPTSVGGAALVGLHDGGIVGSEATFTRYVHPSYFDHARRMHTGGIAGDEVPIIAKKGEGVFTPGQMAAMGGGSSTNITYAPNIDARGADAQAVARLGAAMAQDRQNFERNVQAVVSRTRSNNPGAFK